MNPEYTRQERFIAYTAFLRERFEAGILAELQSEPQWVVWRAELEGEKYKKVPYNPHYHLARASVKIPNSWGTLDQALTALETGNYSGLGFMLTPPLVLIDLDNSYDKATRTITDPQAAAIVQELNSYTEASPGKGLHVLAYGQLPGKNIHTAIEIYGQDRFTTITTNHIAGTPTTVAHRQDAIEALYNRFAPPVAQRDIQNTRGVGGWENALTALPPEAAHDTLLQRLLAGDNEFEQPTSVSRCQPCHSERSEESPCAPTPILPLHLEMHNENAGIRPCIVNTCELVVSLLLWQQLMTNYHLTPPAILPSHAVQEAKAKRRKVLDAAERTRKANYERFLRRMASLQKTLREKHRRLQVNADLV